MNEMIAPHPNLINVYGCEFGKNVFVGPFVEIQKNTKIGNLTRIQSHSFICEGVAIGEDCFIGHGVMFINDLFDGKSHHDGDWIMRNTVIGNRVRIGSNSTILPVKIGDDVIIGAGSVVTKDIPSGSIVKGNPAR